MAYKRIKIQLTKAQAERALSGKSIRVAASQIGNGSEYVSLHPANAKLIEKAALKGSGCCINLSHGELADTADSMNGAGFWGDVWKGVKRGWRVLKDSGILSAAADAAVAPLAAATGQPALVSGARQLLKRTTGVGVKPRRTKAQRMEILKGKGLYLS